MTGIIITNIEELHAYLEYGETSRFEIDSFIVAMIFLLIMPVLIVIFIR